MVERSLSMREAPGSIPGFSKRKTELHSIGDPVFLHPNDSFPANHVFFNTKSCPLGDRPDLESLSLVSGLLVVYRGLGQENSGES